MFEPLATQKAGVAAAVVNLVILHYLSECDLVIKYNISRFVMRTISGENIAQIIQSIAH